ncbi:MAG: glycosyltransferase family 4 protein [Bacteriovoracia bacterium]
MKLAILNDSGLNGGGAETRLRQLLEHWTSSKFIEDFLVLDREALKGDWIKTLKTFNPNLIQAHNLLDTGPSVFKTIARKVSKPIVWFAHDFWPICGRRLLFDYNERRCDGPSLIKCSQCIGPSSTLRERLFSRFFEYVNLGITQTQSVCDILNKHRIHPKKWFVATPWIDNDYFSENSNRKVSIANSPQLLYIGPLTKAKGADLAIETFAKVLEVFPKANLHMVGGEAYHGTWARQLAANLEVEQSIIWKPRLDKTELLKEYQNTDLLLFTSNGEEPFGLVWAQGLAAGSPVVLLETKSISETVPAEIAWLAKSRNDFTVSSINALLDEKTRNQKVIKAKAYANRFRLSQSVGLLEEKYQFLVKHRAS